MAFFCTCCALGVSMGSLHASSPRCSIPLQVPLAISSSSAATSSSPLPRLEAATYYKYADLGGLRGISSSPSNQARPPINGRVTPADARGRRWFASRRRVNYGGGVKTGSVADTASCATRSAVVLWTCPRSTPAALRAPRTSQPTLNGSLLCSASRESR
ncbi:hypothetical protein K466DRAFT_387475 [Polyporus arcularius HHB13444]|uniref:Secreted protein n=1 Tax=Polyporus arcularius HHB13444 TaxID=1314778 RepID=A0A5C3NWA2_9APHY|nr:hypothetical protein K466DRAFT_387475 [Polyporus arcularius HHB13444]